MKKVAYIGKVVSVNPIDGADRIESLEVVCGDGGKWRGTAQKGAHKVDELVEVYLQDALLPQTERFAFMEKHHYRVKMKKFKGVPSECLIMPIEDKRCEQAKMCSVLDFQQSLIASGVIVGQIIPGIEKYEKPIPASLAGEVYGDFPTHLIPKTDEPNFQTVPYMVEALRGKQYYMTEKVDGSSVTYYKYQDHFGVCSRNLELKDKESNTLWNIARKYDFVNYLPEDFAVQAEVYGEGIQGNPLGIKGQDIRIFNVYQISERRYLNYDEMVAFVQTLNAPMVRVLSDNTTFNPPTDGYKDDVLRKMAEGSYDNGEPREGIVIRPLNEEKVNGERLSFKVINLMYKG